MVDNPQARVCALGYLGLASRDPQAWARFAVDVLGLAPATAVAGTRFRLDERAWRIAVEQGDTDGLAYLGLEVAGPEAFAALSARLEAAGVVLSPGDAALAHDRGVAAVTCFVDPDGNRVEIFWGAAEGPAFASPAGTRFLAGATGTGHVLLRATDAVATAAFYADLLGFRLTDYIALGPSASARFLRCNARHHSIALVDALGGVGLEHMMVEVETLDDLGCAYDRALGAGAEIVNSIGRHSNDLMVSFYLRAPGGISIEYGWGGRTIGEDWTATEFHGSGDLWGHHGPMMDEMKALHATEA